MRTTLKLSYMIVMLTGVAMAAYAYEMPLDPEASVAPINLPHYKIITLKNQAESGLLQYQSESQDFISA
jgi:hypothetical protein